MILFTSLTRNGVVGLDKVEKVTKELIASFEHTQSDQWTGEVSTDILSQALHPVQTQPASQTKD